MPEPPASPPVGTVDSVVPFPRGEGRLAVLGSWPRWAWAPGDDLRLRQIRGGRAIGRWRVVGVETSGGLPRRVALVVESAGREPAEIRPGDAMEFGIG